MYNTHLVDSMEYRGSPTTYINFATENKFPLLDVDIQNITEGQKNEQNEAEGSRDFNYYSLIPRIPLKTSVLGLLVVQNSTLALCMFYSRLRYCLCLDCNFVRMACLPGDTIVIMQCRQSFYILHIDTMHLGSTSLYLA